MGGPRSVWKRLGFGTGAVLLGLLVVGFGAEIVLRVIDYRAQGTRMVDWHVGSTFLPGMVGRWTYEGRSLIRVSSQGLRDREFSLQKPPGVFRIAVLGDSFMAALEVPAKLNFAKQLERRLRELGYSVEVMNFGVPGFSTAQEFIYLKVKVMKFRPDLVILGFFPGNDYRNNLRAWQRDDLRPYLIPRPDGTLAVDNRFRGSRSFRLKNSWLGSLMYFFKKNSRLFCFVNDQVNLWRMRRRGRAVRRAAASGRVEPSIYAPHLFPVVARAFRVTARIVDRMAAYCRERKVGFAVMIIPTAAQVHQDQRLNLSRRHPEWRLDAPTDFLRDHCQRRPRDWQGLDRIFERPIPCLDLTPLFRAENQRTDGTFNGFDRRRSGHWSPLAHRRAAEDMARFLIRRNLIPIRWRTLARAGAN